MTTTRGLSLATAMRMVDGIHGDATSLWTHALPPLAPGLADLDELVLGVSDLADGCPAVDRHSTHLGRGEPHRGVLTLFGDQLHGGARGTSHLAAATRAQLDVVHHGADRDVAQGQGIARANLGALTRLHSIADTQAVWRKDVALLSVEIVQQRDAARAVGVVLDRRNLGGNAVFVSFEVDEAISRLVAAATMTGGDATFVVAAAGGRVLRDQRLLGAIGGDLAVIVDRLEAPSCARRVSSAYCHLLDRKSVV